ncbi:hypothetical protein CALVIDRAFT_356282 [Calocera viscosa TUFC12733]|uniref:Uncharacterized protein n=1 Tax=Calocera viscosa (strain TUFC12733) TaxID=1330018 RepID=A0A167QDR6_CALVF|nr:hypothetical protein CALVIDRAFT_356282 [Calocera viscosa TUFC12733]
MWCTRWFLILFLLPYPRASPFFLVLFLFSLVLHSRPCLYCIVLLTALFTSSCYWAPVTLPMPSFLTASNHTILANSANQRCWCDINEGHIFDPFPPVVTNMQGPNEAVPSNASTDDNNATNSYFVTLASNSSYSHLVDLALQPIQKWYSKWALSKPITVDGQERRSSERSSATSRSGIRPWQILGWGDSWLRRRYDLREHGLDLIVDFGWGRGEDMPVGA